MSSKDGRTLEEYLEEAGLAVQKLLKGPYKNIKNAVPSLAESLDKAIYSQHEWSKDKRFAFILSVLENEDSRLAENDLYCIRFVALFLCYGLLPSEISINIISRLLKADELYESGELHEALEVLNDTAQIYVL